MFENKVYIIILNWNGNNDTIECIGSLLRIKYDNYQLILVDNGSDETNYLSLLAWCKKKFTLVNIYSQHESESGGSHESEELLKREKSNEKLIVIRNNENLGFAGGNNVGLRYVLTKQDEDNFSLLLNNDTVVYPDFLGPLVAFMNKYNYAACTPQIRLFNPNNFVWNCGGRITWFGSRRYYFAGQKREVVPKTGFSDITFITGCALLFRPALTGMLTEKFFFGEEDFEFSLRLRKKKLKIACVYNSIIYHKAGSTINRALKEKLVNKVFLFYSSRLIDHKSYYKHPVLDILRLVNLTYATVLVACKYKQGLTRGIKFAIRVNKYVKINNDIKKEKFLKIMNMRF